jgi:cyclopropane fatty-acyl-phospholipid synthase-like methyltransferase
MNDARASSAEQVVAVAEQYYDSRDADNFYLNIWGGEDIHIGLYEETDNIAEASRRTVARMAEQLPGLDSSSRVIDLGAGYGGAARWLAGRFGCEVVCLNLSEVQNETNRRLSAAQGLEERIRVEHGSFESVQEPDATFDVVWSQDAFLHSSRRTVVLAEAFRLLRPGGTLIFTDPMQHDECPPGVLQPVYDRIHLQSLGSFGFYRAEAGKLGFETVMADDLTHDLRAHYARVREVLQADYTRMADRSSGDYLDRMIVGLGNWVDAADKGYLAWGILAFRKP